MDHVQSELLLLQTTQRDILNVQSQLRPLAELPFPLNQGVVWNVITDDDDQLSSPEAGPSRIKPDQQGQSIPAR